MATIKWTKFLGTFYNEILREKFKTELLFLSGSKMNVGITFIVKQQGTYTTLVGKEKNKFLISLGGGDTKEFVGIPDTISSKKVVMGLLPDIIKAMNAQFKHEFGHDKFTDMFCRAIQEYKEPKYIPFIHSTFNILEDQVIEYCMEKLYERDFPREINPRVYFNFLKERLFKPQAEDYKDDGNITSFLNYLLYFFRVGEKNIKEECAIFNKYRKDIMPFLKNIIGEPDGTQRIYKTIEFCEWMIENIKEFNWDEMDSTTIPEPGETAGKFGRGRPAPTGYAPEKGFAGADKEMPSDEKPEGEGESDGESSEDEKDKDDDKIEEKRVESMLNEDQLDEVFNDMLFDVQEHEWVIAKDEFEVMDNTIVDQINDDINHYSSVINDIAKFLNTFKGRIKPISRGGFYSGKIDMRRLIKEEIRNSCDTNFFKRKIIRGKDADLCVSLLTDNSGSMEGRKSVICAKAALALAQACDWSKIPFEVNAFTKTCDSFDGISITIVEKSFDDDFEKAKPYFAINDSTKIRALSPNKDIPTFYGNSEEVNMFHIGEKFKRVKHKTKLMFVLCDGATTGSRDDLRKVILDLQSEGIVVIGIGILDNGVAGIYDNYKVFSTVEQLETELAPYLIDTLSQYAI